MKSAFLRAAYTLHMLQGRLTLPAMIQTTLASLAGLSEHTARYVKAGLTGIPSTAKAYASDLRYYWH